MTTVRARLYRSLDPEAWPTPGLSPLNRAVTTIVFFSIVAAILESEPEVHKVSPEGFALLNIVIVMLFTVEYVLRLWAMGENTKYAGVSGTIKYAVTPASLIDFIATVALWGDVIYQIEGVYGVLLRLARVFRLLRLARKSKWAVAFKLLGQAVAERKRELALSFGFTGTVLLVAATVLFLVEGTAQPEAFGSIPRSLWWAVATLTTIGYGDVYPITALGKVCASVVAITSIAIIAMPTGIMAAAFSDVFSGQKGTKNDKEGPA
ncbi:MAG: ion transporter [Rhodospirillales bacterium]|nr:ion transporter [Rhodospirillales bacterium]